LTLYYGFTEFTEVLLQTKQTKQNKTKQNVNVGNSCFLLLANPAAVNLR